MFLNHYDVIVIGVGTMGAPTCWYLAKNKYRVLGLVDILNKYFPGAGGNVLAVKICMYNNSSDADFIIDFIPDTDSRAVVATGFSGHGFKFASAVGEIVADLATKGKSDMSLDFLRLNRFNK